MDIEQLIALGNMCRDNHKPQEAIAYYAQAFVQDYNSAGAFNNYGNVLREMGYPERGQLFLEHAIQIEPNNEIARFNLAVCYLLMGDYQKGWPAYEDRWNFEHLKNTLPDLPKPKWNGQDINGKTILVIGEQGLGDTIQFSRFCYNLIAAGADVILLVQDQMVTLFDPIPDRFKIIPFGSALPDFDYWTTIMSIPGILGIKLDQLDSPLTYINADKNLVADWLARLGPKKKMRVGFSWSGRKDTWIHQHKSVPFQQIAELVHTNPEYEWINLQIDASDEESAVLQQIGCKIYPGTISCLADSAALISCMDVVVSVDTAVSHLSAALGRPTWIMLNQYGVDWRWLLNRADSPWYPTARLFRQPEIGNWKAVLTSISNHLKLFKI